MRPGRLPAGALLIGFLAMAGLGAAACGSGGTGVDASPVVTSTVDLPTSYKFAPVAISVAAGTTVTWTNHDNFSHSVQFKDGGLPADPLVMQPGQHQAFRFSTPGTYHYQCSFHPQNMQGTVVVTGP
jgi:plastocyanin